MSEDEAIGIVMRASMNPREQVDFVGGYVVVGAAFGWHNVFQSTWGHRHTHSFDEAVSWVLKAHSDYQVWEMARQK